VFSFLHFRQNGDKPLHDEQDVELRLETSCAVTASLVPFLHFRQKEDKPLQEEQGVTPTLVKESAELQKSAGGGKVQDWPERRRPPPAMGAMREANR